MLTVLIFGLIMGIIGWWGSKSEIVTAFTALIGCAFGFVLSAAIIEFVGVEKVVVDTSVIEIQAWDNGDYVRTAGSDEYDCISYSYISKEGLCNSFESNNVTILYSDVDVPTLEMYTYKLKSKSLSLFVFLVGKNKEGYKFTLPERS